MITDALAKMLGDAVEELKTKNRSLEKEILEQTGKASWANAQMVRKQNANDSLRAENVNLKNKIRDIDVRKDVLCAYIQHNGIPSKVGYLKDTINMWVDFAVTGE